MTLDEQLALATNSVAQPVQPTPVAPAQMQAEAQVVQPTVTAPVMQPVVPQVPPVTPAGINLEAAQAEAEQNYGVQEITIGTKISTRAIDPVKKLDKGEKIRFTLISPNIGSAKVHNHPTLGKISCFSTDTTLAQCCRDMDTPKVRYYMPVLVYSTMPNDPKTPLPQGKSELRLLVIWDTGSYNKLCEEIIDADNNWQVDFIATSEDTYGKLDFKAQSTSFRSMPEYTQALKDAAEKWEAVKDKASLTVRRNMDAERYAKLTQQVAVPQLNQYSPDDIVQNNYNY